MLVLSRVLGEEIVIDNVIAVSVVEIRGNKIRLGIRAPRNVPVHRLSVYQAVHAGGDTEPITRKGRPKRGKRGLLVLSRKEGEVITIGDSITITVVEISGNRTRLGVKAPKSVPVHRKEVWELINGSNPPPAGTDTDVNTTKEVA